MKAKSKVIIAITMLFLVSSLAGATSVSAVKAGEVVKVHLSAEGSDLWDSEASILIKANVRHTYISSWTDNAEFKKIGIDPITNEEFMECHGKLKDGVAYYLEWWQDPNTGQWWQYVWIIQGTGVVKTQTDTYPEAYITIIFALGGNWAYAAYDDAESGDSGPNNPITGLGTLTVPIVMEEIGTDQFDFIKQEQETVLNAWLTGDNIIRNGDVVNIAETNYILLGMVQSDEEKKDKIFNLPWTMSMWLDGEEIELSSFWWHDKEGLIMGEPYKLLIFYHIYEPWSLIWGPHTLDHELTWYNGVGSHVWQDILEFQWQFTASWW